MALNQKDSKEQTDKLVRMKELVAQLDQASRAYYQDGNEIMSNFRPWRRIQESSCLPPPRSG